ncbi:glycoside hydrolase family 18, catalytic domain-containing protein [Artemisia annua]|uniref:Glycoside hydrolase family 18, catalytic domain-containing protein n=1 Tax=Artemisia annua TaxID=35608 RepID=A0A2U1MRY6_ARTAN|nr:glycoside hydrolase family 18, catalytic domain-containing protein [Artemisia annua]
MVLLLAVGINGGAISIYWGQNGGGSSSTRQLGDAVLDGIEFDIERRITEHWDDLANYSPEYTSEGKKLVA